MKALFLAKYEQKFVRISALQGRALYCATLLHILGETMTSLNHSESTDL